MTKQLVTLALNKSQIKKVVTGKGLRLTPNKVLKGASNVKVSIPTKVFDALRAAHSMGKAGVITGGSIVGGVDNKIHSIVRRATGGKIKPAKALKKVGKVLGHATEIAKKIVPKGVASKMAMAGAAAAAIAAGQPELAPMAAMAANTAVNAGYRTNMSRGSVGKNFGINLAKSAIGEAMGPAGKYDSYNPNNGNATGGSLEGMRRARAGMGGVGLTSFRDQKAGKFLASQQNQTGSYLPLSVTPSGHVMGSGFLPIGQSSG